MSQEGTEEDDGTSPELLEGCGQTWGHDEGHEVSGRHAKLEVMPVRLPGCSVELSRKQPDHLEGHKFSVINIQMVQSHKTTKITWKVSINNEERKFKK